ncbi:MAG TPA: DUF3489 domain-containing protein [Devosiaceae bacterium]|nr:DUF3489 domain-containing protein [Devosiaceae bacterium]
MGSSTSISDREGKQTKQDALLALLRRPEGASVPEMVAATGGQPHSTRGFMSGAPERRLGLKVTSEEAEGGERRYHVPTAEGDDIDYLNSRNVADHLYSR